MKKLTTEEFISKAKVTHGNKYDYSKLNYHESHTKICITCPVHGEFLQLPYIHLRGFGCPKCGCEHTYSKNAKTIKDFISEAKKIHGDKYDYSKVNYVNRNTKICIICPKHGEFWQLPSSHLRGCGCSKCVGVNNNTTEEFIIKAKEIHGNKYDYSRVEYKNAKVKVCIVCPDHGEFWQTPNAHLSGQGCNLCSKPIHDTISFIEKAKIVHGDKYDYSKVKYVNNKTKVCIVCPEHGEFLQLPSDHIKTNGCSKCGGVYKLSTEEFVEKAKLIHGDKYDYSKVEYKDANTKVCIICSEHGEFYQKPSSHLLRGQGCPICNESKLENEVNKLLIENNVKFERQKKFKWLGKQSLDFYLIDYNIGIECQGIQHFKPVDYFGGDEHFDYVKKLDENKSNLCKDNNVKLLYYTNIENSLINNYIIYNNENFFNNKQLLIEAINNVKIY